MRILYLAHRIPYPPNKGDKIRSYHHVRYLAERHEVHLVAFVDDPADFAGGDALQEICREVVLVPLDRRRALARGALSLARGRSLSEGYFGGEAMRAAVKGVLAGRTFDVAWAFCSPMAEFLAQTNAPLRIADFVDMDSEKWLQLGAFSPIPWRWLYRLEGRRVAALERRASAYADHVLFVAETEAAVLRGLRPKGVDIGVVPNGVDQAYFRYEGDASSGAPLTILFTGALDYGPNIDGVLWFLREVIPLLQRDIPGARFLAVGHRPAPALVRAARRSGGTFEVAGSVPDVRPFFRRAHVYAVPLRMGRGVQNKVLEAMAMGLPVVASPLATAGLRVDPNIHLLVAERPRDFAAAVLSLWREPSTRERLSASARKLVAERYDWEKNLRLLDSYVNRGGVRGMARSA